ncbi:hypothetical protein CDAR_285611 [Caerostris darwini]|uniref:Secreted protein n=1 Tax=Caerostris darwini TaxID=1538125 RepID=A0AAV4NMZ4_9ARAC|nr:hypothetical protein CDAR_285611 [Caerostris darwini]
MRAFQIMRKPCSILWASLFSKGVLMIMVHGHPRKEVTAGEGRQVIAHSLGGGGDSPFICWGVGRVIIRSTWGVFGRIDKCPLGGYVDSALRCR